MSVGSPKQASVTYCAKYYAVCDLLLQIQVKFKNGYCRRDLDPYVDYIHSFDN
jgi:hypothetical protein